MRSDLAVWTLTALLAAACQAVAAASDPNVAPPGAGPIPDGLGANIHFTDPKSGEMKMIAEAGFRWLRMDFVWERIERTKGQYDWTPYDRLLEAGRPHGSRFLFILDYSNKLYESDRSVRTEEGRQAMARWAAEAVRRYRGRGILWEMWNEPNISNFWKPQPNVEDYVKLARAVGQAVRQAAPGEMYVGPATSTVDFRFLEGCFRGGMLEYWSAVSVHPYRQQPPETVEADYRRLRALIDRHAPKGRSIPILSGEWGYSSVWKGFDEARQGRYLPRQWLVNLANDVPMSIWYDWHDDGRDPKEPEHHFGTVLNPEHKGRDPLYDPKPAYLAARTLATVLKGFRYNKRLGLCKLEDYVLLFSRGQEVAVAAWTTAAEPRACTIPASAGRFRAVSHTGEELPAAAADKGGLAVTLTDAPVYYVPEKSNDLLRVAAAWERAPQEIRRRGPAEEEIKLSLTNPLDRPIRVELNSRKAQLASGERAELAARVTVTREPEPRRFRPSLEVEGLGAVAQDTMVVATNPLSPRVVPPAGDKLLLQVDNLSGEALRGRLVLRLWRGESGTEPLSEADLVIPQGRTEAAIPLSLEGRDARNGVFCLHVQDSDGRTLCGVPRIRVAPVDDFGRYAPETLGAAYAVAADGDAKAASAQSLALADPPAGPPVDGVKSLRIAYDMKEGWKFVRLAVRDKELAKIEGQPAELRLWLCGDGSGHSPRCRFTDATGQTFQPTGESIHWKGWRCVSFRMDGRQAGHWGGADDGVVHYPIRWDALLLIDKPREQAGAGEVYVAAPMLVH